MEVARGSIPKNVLGQPLETCGTEPMTGFFRDGCCKTGPEDFGVHTLCCVVTEEFLRVSAQLGNDLSTPMPQFGFPGSSQVTAGAYAQRGGCRFSARELHALWFLRRPMRRHW